MVWYKLFATSDGDGALDNSGAVEQSNKTYTTDELKLQTLCNFDYSRKIKKDFGLLFLVSFFYYK